MPPPGPDAVQTGDGHPSPEVVRLQLERILENPLFKRSTRLSAFLRYVVEQTLAGRGDGIKEQILALELYGRNSDFDGGLDPIVRVDARRLRDKLREYYAESPGEPVIITLPKGSYVPAFELPKTTPFAQASSSLLSGRSPPTLPSGDGGPPCGPSRFIAAIAVTALLLYSTSPNKFSSAVLFSPDGRLVAFISNRTGTAEVWLSALDGSDLRRLTDIKGDPVFPFWSSDSRRLSFLSAPGRTGNKRIYTVGIDGGDPKPLTGETEIVFPGSWSRDGRWIYFMSDRSGEMQIWRMSPSGEHAVQVTRNGGFEAQEFFSPVSRFNSDEQFLF